MDLLPCPFCGKDAEIKRLWKGKKDKWVSSIRCKTLTCPARCTRTYLGEDKAEKKWNERKKEGDEM